MRYRGMLLKERYADDVVLRALETAKTTLWKVKDASRELKTRWTVISFEVDSPSGEAVAEIFTRFLKKHDWFVFLHNDDWSHVIFADKSFKYPKGEAKGRANAVEYARSIKIPELLLSWRE